MTEEKQIGKVFSFFSKIGVAAIELTEDSLALGDKIRIKGTTTDFEQEVDSMQIEGKEVQEVGPGKSVGMKVKDKVRPGDLVYKVL
jgi:translation initiation factor IF-2